MFGAANTLLDLIHIQQQIRQKKVSPKTPRKKFENLGPPPLPFRVGRRGASSIPKMGGEQRGLLLSSHFGSGRRSRPAHGRGPRGEGRRAAGSPTPQPTSQKPVFSSFQILLIIFVPSKFSILWT